MGLMDNPKGKGKTEREIYGGKMRATPKEGII